MKIAFIIDPPETIKPQKDSSVALMQAGLELGHDVFYIVQHALYIADGMAMGTGQSVTKADEDEVLLAEHEDKALGAFDAIFMRKDPPVDQAFMQATYILAQGERDGARVLNAPSALQKYNEKIYATLFPDLIPKTIVSADKGKIIEFVGSLKRAVLKPVDMMGGYGIFVSDAEDPNLDVIIEMLTNNGKTHIIVQRFLPEILEGDRRLIMIDGEIASHALVRYPKQGSLRGNLAAGGTYKVEPVNERDREIATIVGARLVKDGVYFAGLDVIGGHLIEINHTSPTGLREISKASGDNLAKKIIEGIAKPSVL